VKLFGGKQPTPINEFCQLCLPCSTEAKKGYLVRGMNSKGENNKIELCISCEHKNCKTEVLINN